MHNKEIFSSIELEMRKIKKETPSWPDHVAAQAGYVVSEAGSLVSAALSHKYNQKLYVEFEYTKGISVDVMKRSAVRTAAMAIRFLENLKEKQNDL